MSDPFATEKILRFHASDGQVFDRSNNTVVVTRALLTSAADEIERLRASAQEAPFPNKSLEDDIETSVRAILNFCSEDHSPERKIGYVRERIMRHIAQAAPYTTQSAQSKQVTALLAARRQLVTLGGHGGSDKIHRAVLDLIDEAAFVPVKREAR